MDELEYFMSQKGKPLLFYNGIRYLKKRDNRSGSSVWYCAHRRRCEGRLTIVDDKIVGRVDHLCAPDPAKQEVTKALIRAKMRARHDRTAISQIYKEELEPLRQRMAGVSSGRMPDYPSLKSSLYRQRKISQAQAVDATTADADRRPRCEDASAGLMEGEGEVIRCFKGKEKLCLKGYIYTLKYTSAKTKRWKCSKKMLFRCNGGVSSNSIFPYTTFENFREHNHPPNEGDKEMTKIRLQIKEAALNSNLIPNKLVAKTLQSIPNNIRSRIHVESVKRDIRRWRQLRDQVTNLSEGLRQQENIDLAAPITPRQQPPQLGPSTSKAPLASTPLPFPIPLPSVPHTPLVSDVIPPPPVPQKTYLPPPPPPTYPALPNLPQRPPSPIAPAPPPCPPTIQDEAVTVQWNSYATNMSTVMPNLLEDEKFVDVTLACDGQYIKCHKVILGACSSYFEELLSANPCKHPIILMKDFQFSEIKAIVEFIYRGSVNIPHEKLPDILQVANKLKIKGLMGSKENDSSTEHVDTDDNSCSRLAMFNASISSASSGIAGKEKPLASKRKPSQNTLKTPRSTSPRSLSTSSTSAEPHRKQPKLFYSHLQDDPESSSSSLRSDNSFSMTDASADFGGSLELLTGTTRIKEESSFLDPSTLYHQNTDNSFVTSPFELLTVQSNIKLEPEEPQQNFSAGPVNDDPGASVSEDPSI